MKKLILVLVMGTLMSCSKDAETTPIVSPVVQTGNKVLDVKIDTLGINYTNVAPYKVNRLLGANDQEIGKTFYYMKDSMQCTVFYEYAKGITMFMGLYNGHGYTVNLSTSTLNLCGGVQNAKISYTLK